jgi:hypothetical protein
MACHCFGEGRLTMEPNVTRPARVPGRGRVLTAPKAVASYG